MKIAFIANAAIFEDANDFGGRCLGMVVLLPTADHKRRVETQPQPAPSQAQVEADVLACTQVGACFVPATRSAQRGGGEDGDAPKGRVYGEHRRTWVYVDVIFHAAAPAGHLGSVLKAVVIDG